MELFITDSPSLFASSPAGSKLLIRNSTIHKQSGFDAAAIERFNLSLTAVETLAAEDMIAELKQVAAKAPKLSGDPFRITRQSNYDIAYGYLYPHFKHFVLKRNIFERVLRQFCSIFSISKETRIELNLAGELALLEGSSALQIARIGLTLRGQELALPAVSSLKNTMYTVYNLLHLRRYPKPDKRHALLFIYDTANDINLFKHFVSLAARSREIKLSIVQISSGMDPKNVEDASQLKIDPAIDIYYFKDFKARVAHHNEGFYGWAESVDPRFRAFRSSGLLENLDVYYSYTNNIIQKLKPEVTFYDNTGEIGRAITDVSRAHRIPCVNVEYSLFTDDAIHMESNIQFSARACLGPSTIDLWKKRNDPSLSHVPIGFLRLDETKNQDYDKESFFRQYGLDVSRPTIFFASTWSGMNDVYDLEKARIIRGLGLLCKKHSWNLIVKKHPSERDQHANEGLKDVEYPMARVFEHKELPLYKALSFSDIATTQFSGVSVEALYFRKPILFINLSESNWANLSIMKDEPYVLSLHDFEAVEQSIIEILKDRARFEQRMDEGIQKYLYRADGKAGQRLIELLATIKHGL